MLPPSRLRFLSLPLIGAALLLFGTACGGASRQSAREIAVEKLVQDEVREDVTCRDNHAVNTEMHPDYDVTFICRNADDAMYVVVASAAGTLRDVSGPRVVNGL